MIDTSRFEIVQKDAGQGGFGRIDKALDNQLDRFIAIKSLDPLFSLTLTADDIERFKREAKTLAKFSNPNIPAIYDVLFNPENKEFKIIFEWIEGLPVNRRILDVGPYSLEEVIKHFSGICSALSHAHSKNIVHRDIKPSNLIVSSENNTCYLVDFGISITTDESRRLSNSTVGTPAYMSPEQQRGEEITTVSDIYSLGVVLYELLSGQLPCVQSYVPLSEINETIPSAIDDIIKKCLKEKNERIQTISEFIHSLTSSISPNNSLKDYLTDGSLADIAMALESISERDIQQLPAGQKRLIFSRIKDLISVDRPSFRNAVASLLGASIRHIPSFVASTQQSYLICNSIKYGYDIEYSEKWKGNPQIRENLKLLATKCNGEIHKIIVTELSKFWSTITQLDHLESWFAHDLRFLFNNLLANENCDDESAELVGGMFDKINEETHA